MVFNNKLIFGGLGIAVLAIIIGQIFIYPLLTGQDIAGQAGEALLQDQYQTCNLNVEYEREYRCEARDDGTDPGVLIQDELRNILDRHETELDLDEVAAIRGDGYIFTLKDTLQHNVVPNECTACGDDVCFEMFAEDEQSIISTVHSRFGANIERAFARHCESYEIDDPTLNAEIISSTCRDCPAHLRPEQADPVDVSDDGASVPFTPPSDLVDREGRTYCEYEVEYIANIFCEGARGSLDIKSLDTEAFHGAQGGPQGVSDPIEVEIQEVTQDTLLPPSVNVNPTDDNEVQNIRVSRKYSISRQADQDDCNCNPLRCESDLKPSALEAVDDTDWRERVKDIADAMNNLCEFVTYEEVTEGPFSEQEDLGQVIGSGIVRSTLTECRECGSEQFVIPPSDDGDDDQTTTSPPLIANPEPEPISGAYSTQDVTDRSSFPEDAPACCQTKCDCQNAFSEDAQFKYICRLNEQESQLEFYEELRDEAALQGMELQLIQSTASYGEYILVANVNALNTIVHEGEWTATADTELCTNPPPQSLLQSALDSCANTCVNAQSRYFTGPSIDEPETLFSRLQEICPGIDVLETENFGSTPSVQPQLEIAQC